MKANADLRKMLDEMGCHAPIRFANIRFPYRAEGLCIPGVGIFVDKKYQTQAIPDQYLQAVVHHEVGHWRDPVAWLSLLVIPVLLLMVYALAATGNPDFLLAIYGLLVAGYFVGIWKERRANAYARRHMADYDVYDKPFVPS
jgi:hypothetical protein